MGASMHPSPHASTTSCLFAVQCRSAVLLNGYIEGAKSKMSKLLSTLARNARGCAARLWVALHLRLKAHVEHAVRLIENQVRHAAARARLHLDQIDHAPGRAHGNLRAPCDAWSRTYTRQVVCEHMSLTHCPDSCARCSQPPVTGDRGCIKPRTVRL
jgi:hypothetical protein